MTAPRWAALALAPLLALVAVVLPCRLFYEGARRLSWRLLLGWAVYCGFVAVAVIFLGPEVYYWLTGNPRHNSPLLLRAALFAALGLPLLQAAWSLAAALLWRDGWRLVRLIALALASCGLLAAAMLWLDHGELDDEQRYVFDGWYRIWLPALFVTGVLLILANLGRAAWGGLAGKPRKKRVKPALAPTAL